MATIPIWYDVAKFDAYTRYHCQVINGNRHYPGSLTVAMATILVGST